MRDRCAECPVSGMACRGQSPGWGNVCGMRETLGDTWVIAASRADVEGPTLESAPLVPLAVPLPRERAVVTNPGGCGSCGGSVETDQRMPSLWERAKHFAGAMGRFAASGFEILDEEGVKARLGICKTCPHLRSNGDCGKCGCPVSRKALLASEFCDDDRWPKEEITEPVEAGAI